MVVLAVNAGNADRGDPHFCACVKGLDSRRVESSMLSVASNVQETSSVTMGADSLLCYLYKTWIKI